MGMELGLSLIEQTLRMAEGQRCHSFFSLRNIVNVIMSGRVRLAGRTTHEKSMQTFGLEKSQGK
jgi:hypothetical protein